MFKKIVLILLLLSIPVLMGARLSSRKDNEIAKFVLDGSGKVAIRITTVGTETILMRKVQPDTEGIAVTGTGSPSPNGTYTATGETNKDHPVYSSGTSWYIFFGGEPGMFNFWVITSYIPTGGYPTGNWWQRTGGDVTEMYGSYTMGGGSYSGTPVVGDGPPVWKTLVDDETDWMTTPFTGIIKCIGGAVEFRTPVDTGNVVTLPENALFSVKSVLLNDMEVKTSDSTDYVLIYGGSW